MIGMQAPASRRAVSAERYDLLADEIERLREENERLKEALGLTIEIPAELGLSPAMRRVLAVLLKRDRVPREALSVAMTTGRDCAHILPDDTLVSCLMVKMRKRLRPLGVTISTDWGFGYYLTAENKAKLRELIAAAK